MTYFIFITKTIGTIWRCCFVIFGHNFLRQDMHWIVTNSMVQMKTRKNLCNKLNRTLSNLRSFLLKSVFNRILGSNQGYWIEHTKEFQTCVYNSILHRHIREIVVLNYIRSTALLVVNIQFSLYGSTRTKLVLACRISARLGFYLSP